MTPQEAYEGIRDYFSQPGAVLAKNEDSQCYYRMTLEDGRVVKCAAGCLIPDELYDRKMEYGTVWALVRGWDKLANYFGSAADFVDDAQQEHDHSSTTTVEQFLDKLDRLAIKYGLEVK